MKNLPVSKKFYNDIISRITSTFADMNDGERCLRGAVAMIDGYLAGDNPECADPMIKMVFSLLRPEIDRAMARSLRARQRGRKRKSSSPSPSASAAAASPLCRIQPCLWLCTVQETSAFNFIVSLHLFASRTYGVRMCRISL